MNHWILAIGGHDPSGAAGLTADVRTAAALGVHAATVVTSLTVQGRSHWGEGLIVSDAKLVKRQLGAILADGNPDAIKIGMVGSGAQARVLASTLKDLDAPMVLDPVRWSSTGGTLVGADAWNEMVARLVPLATLVCANVPEVEAMTGLTLRGPDDVPPAAGRLRALGARAVYIKGGHLGGTDGVFDFFADDEAKFWVVGTRHPRLVRGTGCTLAATLVAALARREPLTSAVIVARGLMSFALSKAREGGVLCVPHWPVPSDAMPWVTNSVPAQRDACVPLEDKGLGFYPIVERASQVASMIDAGARTVQLRIKVVAGADCSGLSRPQLEPEVVGAIALGRERGARVFINDHWELACKHRAYGVHLGQEDLLTADLQRIRQCGLRVGVSTHSHLELARALALRPSYVALGPIFPTTCKSMRFAPQGLDRVGEWVTLSGDVPVVAIGGLSLEYARDVRDQGASGAAVISDVQKAADPAARARAWVKTWGRCDTSLQRSSVS